MITGGAGGIGMVYAEALASAGASVVVADPDGPAAEHAAKDLTAKGDSAASVHVDVSSSESTHPVSEWDCVMNVNLRDPLLCTQAVRESMTARGGGRIVKGSSAGADMTGGIYGVTKFALHGLTANLAAQPAPGMPADPSRLSPTTSHRQPAQQPQGEP